MSQQREIVGNSGPVPEALRDRAVRRTAWSATLFGLVGLAALAAAPSSARAEGIVDVGAGLVFDNNVSNGQLGLDIKGDTAAWTSLSVGQVIDAGAGNTLSATADLEGRVFDRFGGLNHLSIGATVADRIKLGLGANAPWIRAHASFARLQFQNDIRNGWVYQFGVAAGTRFADRWELQAAYRFDRRTGPNTVPDDPDLSGAVFDQTGNSLLFDGHYAFDGVTRISAGYAWRRGDVVSTTRENVGTIAAATAIAADPVFGVEAYAYKLRATTQMLRIGASRQIDRHSSLSVGVQRQITHASGNNSYFNNVFSLTYLYSE